MALRDILLILDGSPRDTVVTDMAVSLAQRDNAHLSCLLPLDLLFPASLRAALSGYPDFVVWDTFDLLEAQSREQAAKIEAGFRERLRVEALHGDWQLGVGDIAELIRQRTHTVDLVVLGQDDPEDPRRGAVPDLVEQALLAAGRPLLILPYVGKFETLGTRVLIAWNGSREAARAAHDALPVIAPGAAVTVLTIARHDVGEEEIPGADIAEHLARHGLAVTLDATVRDRGTGVDDVLLSAAADLGSDLVVLGGYGHSRTRESLLGGVSQGILKHMTVPVLMSH